jgi:single-strand DNA-binding protein
MPINRVTIVGNLTRDPELRTLPSGGSVCSLRVAVNSRRRDQSGEWVEEPNFFNVSIFGNSADAAGRFLSKGRQVAVDGRLRWREWQDQQGNKRESIEIVAQEVQFIGGRDGAPGGGGGGGNGGGWNQQQPAPQDDWGAPPAQAPQQAPPQQPQPAAAGGFGGGGGNYAVDQGDFGGPRQGGGSGGGYNQGGGAPADDDIPF